MESIAALSVDENLWTMAKGIADTPFVLHSHFNRTINYLYKGRMLTLASESIDNATDTVRLSKKAFQMYFQVVPQEVILSKKGIQVDKQCLIEWDGAELWRGEQPVFPSETSILARNIELVKQSLMEQKKPVWAHLDNEGSEKSVNDVMQELIYQESQKLFEALRDFPNKNKQLEETKLFGLGVGLTPSGDDVLTGVSFVSSMPNYPIDLSQQHKKWNKRAEQKTNKISETAIYQATKGQGRESMHVFLKALFSSQDKKELLESLEHVLAIGSSSGSEIVWGMIQAAEIGYTQNNAKTFKEEHDGY